VTGTARLLLRVLPRHEQDFAQGELRAVEVAASVPRVASVRQMPGMRQKYKSALR
jgi:hypothetical protein